MAGRYPVVFIQPEAPAKPALGDPCNGCGLCCLAEPCPVGIVLSRRRRGPCVALRWSPDERRYLCGALTAVPAPLKGWVARWIGAGVGCDADLSAEPVHGP